MKRSGWARPRAELRPRTAPVEVGTPPDGRPGARRVIRGGPGRLAPGTRNRDGSISGPRCASRGGSQGGSRGRGTGHRSRGRTPTSRPSLRRRGAQPANASVERCSRPCPKGSTRTSAVAQTLKSVTPVLRGPGRAPARPLPEESRRPERRRATPDGTTGAGERRSGRAPATAGSNGHEGQGSRPRGAGTGARDPTRGARPRRPGAGPPARRSGRAERDAARRTTAKSAVARSAGRPPPGRRQRERARRGGVPLRGTGRFSRTGSVPHVSKRSGGTRRPGRATGRRRRTRGPRAGPERAPGTASEDGAPATPPRTRGRGVRAPASPGAQRHPSAAAAATRAAGVGNAQEPRSSEGIAGGPGRAARTTTAAASDREAASARGERQPSRARGEGSRARRSPRRGGATTCTKSATARAAPRARSPGQRPSAGPAHRGRGRVRSEQGEEKPALDGSGGR